MPLDGTIVSKVQVPGLTSEYEIKATITLNSTLTDAAGKWKKQTALTDE